MVTRDTFRLPLFTALIAAMLCAHAALAQASKPAVRPAAPLVRPQRPQQNQAKPQPNQEHLAQWLERHRNLSLQQQHQALESEPGFHDLPAQTQQRMRDRLTQLNAMAPAQRQRILEHNEVMEHLSPPQRQQVRSAMQQLGALPEDRRRVVARAFRDLRDMPESQRQAALNSDRFRSFSDQERGTLNGLLAVEPLLSARRPGDPP